MAINIDMLNIMSKYVLMSCLTINFFMLLAVVEPTNLEVLVGRSTSLTCTVSEACRHKIDYKNLELWRNGSERRLNSSIDHNGHGVRLYFENVTGDVTYDLPLGRSSITCQVAVGTRTIKRPIAVCVSSKSFML